MATTRPSRNSVPRLPDDPDAAARHQQHAGHRHGAGARLEVLECHRAALAVRRGPPDDLVEQDGQEQLENSWRPGCGPQERGRRSSCCSRPGPPLPGQGPDARPRRCSTSSTSNQREENDPELKVPDLHGVRADAGHARRLPGAARLLGRLPQRVDGPGGTAAGPAAFAEKARILVSTDAGGEGLNLQFCHVIVNYDLPWNPMRIEQRIGRVDRIGQKHVVRA